MPTESFLAAFAEKGCRTAAGTDGADRQPAPPGLTARFAVAHAVPTLFRLVTDAAELGDQPGPTFGGRSGPAPGERRRPAAGGVARYVASAGDVPMPDLPTRAPP